MTFFKELRTGEIFLFIGATSTLGILVFAVYYNEADLKRKSLTEIDSHVNTLYDIEVFNSCLKSFVKLPRDVAKDVLKNRYMVTRKKVNCDESWCWLYQSCVGEFSEIRKGKNRVFVDAHKARVMMQKIEKGMESWESLSNFACHGAIDDELTFNVLERHLPIYDGTIEYMISVYGYYGAHKKYPSYTGLLNKIYPEHFPDWREYWSNGCRTKPRRIL